MYKGFKKFRWIVFVQIQKDTFSKALIFLPLSLISKNNTPQTLVIFDNLFCHFFYRYYFKIKMIFFPSSSLKTFWICEAYKKHGFRDSQRLKSMLAIFFIVGINIFTLSLISKSNTPQILVIFDTLFCHFFKKVLKTTKEKKSWNNDFSATFLHTFMHNTAIVIKKFSTSKRKIVINQKETILHSIFLDR